MTILPSLPPDDVWTAIVAEAREAASSGPSRSRSLSAAIFDHAGFADALAYQIGRRLGFDQDRHGYTEVVLDVFEQSPEIVEAACVDLEGIRGRDPAVTGFLPVFLYFKGYVALQAWRVSHWLWLRERRDLALLFQNAASQSLQISIHPSAVIGRSVFLDHGTGIVIGAHVKIGDGVTILQNVTLGRPGGADRSAPTIGRDVFMGAGATILGSFTVGDAAKIGAGSVVTMDVPAGCTAVGTPARLVNCPELAS